MLLGVDTGGTFTDFVAFDGKQIRIHKVLSTPAAPEQAILQGIEDLGLTAAMGRGEVTVIHGSTVATNAALERKGVRTVFITNRGFADMLTIGRQTRAELYNLRPKKIPPPVPKELCLELDCRIDAQGREIVSLDDAQLEQLNAQLEDLQPQAVAINFLFSFLNDTHERAVADTLPGHMFVSRSSQVLAEYKEYERGIATWLNAWLGPIVERYLTNLQQQLQPATIAVMQSSGGTIAADHASRRAVNLLLSGPAGGLAAAKYVGDSLDDCRLMTFDMGGTSTDVALIDNEISLTNEGRIGHYPIAVPMVNMHTIDAGGGSIAYIDAGGALQVGPESAGADPGPACYGKGGRQATVTDANLVLGRLGPAPRLGGTLQLDVKASRAALNTLAVTLGKSIETTALGIIELANEHMASALRVISIQRGYDPKDFQLCCFGGAGGLHLCALADALGMRSAVVPAFAGVLSAFGMLVAPRSRNLSRTWQQPLATLSQQALDDVFAALEQQGLSELVSEGLDPTTITANPSLDLRYEGQSFTLSIPWQGDLQTLEETYHSHHQRRYGHDLNVPIEVVNVRMQMRAPPGKPVKLATLTGTTEGMDTRQSADLPIIVARDVLRPGMQINGPAIITETIATTYVEEGWSLRCHANGHLLLEKEC